MQNEFLYRGYPIILEGDCFLVYNPKNGEVIVSNKDSYESVCDKLGEINPISRRYKENLSVSFCLTYSCNLACKYCSANANRQKIIMSEKIIDGVLEYVKQLNPKKLKICFTGGEPTIAMDKIKYIMTKAKEANYNPLFVINTNGIISKENLDFLIKNKFKIFVSIDGLKEKHDSQRIKVNGDGTFDDLINNLKYLAKHNASVIMRSTLTDYSIEDLLKLVDLASNIGIKVLRVANVTECGKAKVNNLKPAPFRKYHKYFKEAVKKAKEKGIMLIAGHYVNLFTPATQYCATIAGSGIIVTPEGNLTGCFACYKDEDPYSDHFIYGKYDQKTKSIKIDKDKKYFLENFNVEKLKVCDDCFCKYICSGGCPLIHGIKRKNINFSRIEPEYCKYVRDEIRTAILNLERINDGNDKILVES